jgi:small conductance mechanosensitive channel
MTSEALVMENDKLVNIFNTLDAGMLLELFLIVAAATLLIIGAQRVLPWIANRLHGKRRLYLLAMVPLLRLIIILAAFLLIVPLIIKPSLHNMVVLLGSVGLALGFALKDYASSLIAGVVAVGEMPYRNGDWIEMNGIYGEVTHVGMRTVRIVTPDDTVVYIPHLRLWNDPVFNANDGAPRLQCVADFYLHPQHDAAVARQVLQDVASTSPYLCFDKPVVVIVQEKPWGTHYRLKAYPIDSRQQFRFITDLTVRGKAVLTRLGVSFAIAPASVGMDA